MEPFASIGIDPMPFLVLVASVYTASIHSFASVLKLEALNFVAVCKQHGGNFFLLSYVTSDHNDTHTECQIVKLTVRLKSWKLCGLF